MWKGAIARNVGLLTAANLLMRGVGMLFQVYLTARVGAAGVGLLQLITAVQFFAMTLGTSGLRVAALTLTAEEYGYRRFGGVRQAMAWCLGAGLALSTLVGGLLLALAEPVAVLWVRDVQAIKSLRLLGITLPVNCLSAVLAGCFTACGQVRKLVAVEIGDKIATVGITMLLLRRGVAGDLAHACASIVAGNALAAAGSVTVLLVLLYRWLRNLEGERASGMGGRLWRIAVPVALSDYLRSGLSTLEQFLIPWGFARNSGSSSQAMADYGTIHGMVFPILMFPSTVLGAVSDVLVPELARRRAQGNRERIESLVRRCLVLGLFYGAAVAGLLYVLASPAGGGHLPQCRRRAVPQVLRAPGGDALPRPHCGRHAQGTGAAGLLRPGQHHHVGFGRGAALFPAAALRRGGLLLELRPLPRREFLFEHRKAPVGVRRQAALGAGVPGDGGGWGGRRGGGQGGGDRRGARAGAPGGRDLPGAHGAVASSHRTR